MMTQYDSPLCRLNIHLTIDPHPPGAKINGTHIASHIDGDGNMTTITSLKDQLSHNNRSKKTGVFTLGREFFSVAYAPTLQTCKVVAPYPFKMHSCRTVCKLSRIDLGLFCGVPPR